MTYEELLDQIQGKGQSWSQWDLETARKNPAFGASMLTYKQDWAEATDQAGRTAANQAAEALRRQYGSYLGGSDGSKYYGLGGPGSYQSSYQDRISEILDEMDNYQDFDYGPAPTYNNRYQETLDELLGKVENYGPFSWSKEEDPAYSAYAKQYRREGQRATADAMAQAAALTGGQVSTAAATAASQAGDYYAGQLADVIPQLYENAYQRYLSDYSLLADQLGQVRQAEQLDYAKYLDELGQYNADRNLSYDQWLQGYNMLSGNLSAFQGQDQTEYGRLLDQIEYNMQQDALDRELAAEQQNLYQAQVDAILSAGGTPSDALVGPSGYSDEYVNALRAYYAAQAAPSGGGGGSGSSGGSGSESGEQDYQGLFEAAMASGHPKSYIANNYKRFNFNSATGLYDDYEAWEVTQSPENESGQEMNPDHYRATANAIVAQIESGKPEAAVGTLEARWDELSESQREGLQRLLETYGYYYEEG